jgi:hypothetical protein
MGGTEGREVLHRRAVRRRRFIARASHLFPAPLGDFSRERLSARFCRHSGRVAPIP